MKQKIQSRLDDLSADEIVMACEQNYEDYWRCIGFSRNARFSEDGGVVRCLTGINQEIFNVVLRCDLGSGAVDAALDNSIVQFRSNRLPMIWHVGRLTKPSDLGRFLEERGYPHDYDLEAMALDLESFGEFDSRSSQIAVKTVADENDRRHWANVLSESWESPQDLAPWIMNNSCFNSRVVAPFKREMFLGFLDGRPVSACMLLWSDKIAGLQAVGTVREAQRRGSGSATVSAAARLAVSLGFKFVVVLSTVEGVGLYRRLGFRSYGRLPEHSMHFERPGQWA